MPSSSERPEKDPPEPGLPEVSLRSFSALPASSRLKEILRSAGLRATSPRLAVLEHLLSRAAPVSHAEVAEALGRDGFDRATVYRNLVDLTEVGLARRTDLGDHVWRFELVASTDRHRDQEHPHFICGSCGAVECLPEGVVAIRASRSTLPALRRKGLSVQLRGVCDACA
jgi:Fur family ferric uptake transcriptional regulator